MTTFRWNNLEMLHLLWLVPCVALLFLYAFRKRRQALLRFAAANLVPHLTAAASDIRRRWKAVLLISAFTLIVIALARPSWNPKPRVLHRHGRDVVFVLDVSRSMLAEDLKPNRLERAKLAIKDCIDTLDGDRVALVVFAGTAVVKCPLTLDYGFFRMMLDSIDVDSVSRGGTLIGDALRTTMNNVFDNEIKEFKDVILITDGEDHDSFPVQAAEEMGKRGIRLLAIGLGDEKQGQRIPVTDKNGKRTFLKYKGKEVWTRLDAETLRKMIAKTPGGRYLNVATGTFDLGKIYQDLVASAEKHALKASTVTVYEEKFQLFLIAAFVLLCVEYLVSDRKKATALAGKREELP